METFTDLHKVRVNGVKVKRSLRIAVISPAAKLEMQRVLRELWVSGGVPTEFLSGS
jgi:hypothetical protein